ncbi:MAG: TolC family outer membrane protein [Hyphomicrobiaceae bacterium]
MWKRRTTGETCYGSLVRCIGARAVLAVATMSVATVPHGAANAETLHDALRSAYRFNPQLDSERAILRATDEGVPQAKSNYRPSVSFSADSAVVQTNLRPDSPPDEGRSYPAGYSINLNQQIFRGFRTRNAVNAAEARVRAGREILRSTEQSVLLSAVAAYMNVVRDAAIVLLREGNVRVLSRELKATQDRFAIGELTSTDVAQARARRAGGAFDLEQAQANLKASRANYERIIGHQPSRLVGASPPLRLLPKGLAEARQWAERENPNVVAALYNEQAARFDVNEVAGELLPTFNLDASYSNLYTGGGDLQTTQTETGIVIGTLTVPLYQRGAVSSRVRQAKHVHVSAIQLIEQARTEARESAVAAWAQLKASRAQVKFAQSQIEANKLALAGVRGEEKVGQRTVIDVLDAELELVTSRQDLVSVRRDLVVNAYTVLAATGRFTAQNIGLASQIYDPEAHYSEVRRKWSGISITHADGRREHIQAQDKGRSRLRRVRP